MAFLSKPSKLPRLFEPSARAARAARGLLTRALPLAMFVLVVFSVGGVCASSLALDRPVPRGGVVAVAVLFCLLLAAWCLCACVVYKRKIDGRRSLQALAPSPSDGDVEAGRREVEGPYEAGPGLAHAEPQLAPPAPVYYQQHQQNRHQQNRHQHQQQYQQQHTPRRARRSFQPSLEPISDRDEQPHQPPYPTDDHERNNTSWEDADGGWAATSTIATQYPELVSATQHPELVPATQHPEPVPACLNPHRVVACHLAVTSTSTPHLQGQLEHLTAEAYKSSHVDTRRRIVKAHTPLEPRPYPHPYPDADIIRRPLARLSWEDLLLQLARRGDKYIASRSPGPKTASSPTSPKQLKCLAFHETSTSTSSSRKSSARYHPAWKQDAVDELVDLLKYGDQPLARVRAYSASRLRDPKKRVSSSSSSCSSRRRSILRLSNPPSWESAGGQSKWWDEVVDGPDGGALPAPDLGTLLPLPLSPAPAAVLARCLGEDGDGNGDVHRTPDLVYAVREWETTRTTTEAFCWAR